MKGRLHQKTSLSSWVNRSVPTGGGCCGTEGSEMGESEVVAGHPAAVAGRVVCPSRGWTRPEPEARDLGVAVKMTQGWGGREAARLVDAQAPPLLPEPKVQGVS